MNKKINFKRIDEVESLTTARNSMISGTDPSDAIRVLILKLLLIIDYLKGCKCSVNSIRFHKKSW